jgi:signal transduction histidine kinase
LPWLSPAAGSLVALADDRHDVRTVLQDPALVVHVLRLDPDWTPETPPAAAVLTVAADHLESESVSRTDWQSKIDPRILSLSRTAGAVAAECHSADPVKARIAASLAPLGWFAVAAVEPGLATPDRATVWGLSAAAIARRLLRAWNLPDWLAAVVGNLGDPVELAESLGADPDLFRAVQAAVAATEKRVIDLTLAPTADRALTDRAAAVLRDVEPAPSLPTRFGVSWTADPRTVPLLTPLLRAKAAARRAVPDAPLARTEAENDVLRGLLADARTHFTESVRDAKLAALAELSAGAGHEINNPLAVISGHCQRLLGHEEDEETRHTLQTVVRQTKRIHDILRGLMQFARPAKPTPQTVRVTELIGTALAEVKNLAAVKAVEVREEVATSGRMSVDLHQMRTCLVNVLRNAVDAAGPDGWVRVAASADDDRVTLVVEDSGPGPKPNQAAHLFDPFYSGRTAGRGRGLGLSVAWRLAQINGGSLRHEPLQGSPARFVLTLPTADHVPARISA